MTATPHPLLVDTDLATDPDDLLALLHVASSPEFDLRAITTTYGDTELRARIAREVCDELGISPTVATGPTSPISGRAIWYAGNERGQLHRTSTDHDERFGDAVETILELSRTFAGELQIVAIGPLTNLALAVTADPKLPERVDRLALMGGDFSDDSPDPHDAEHNLRCDADAARIVFEAGFDALVIGVDQTRRLPVSESDTARWIGDGGSAARRRVERDLDWWHGYNDSTDTLVHDPLAALMLSHPELFEFETAPFTVDTAPSEGRIVRRGSRPVRVVRSVDERARSLIVERVAASLDAAPGDDPARAGDDPGAAPAPTSGDDAR
ncbi:nucleoside hydrolase [Ilumatobacter sp.]|uniref:nucleoside hydrolase n=1 Tax=Ilumatobacter sp. TaxID=1967498 RepID=UPI003B51FA62